MAKWQALSDLVLLICLAGTFLQARRLHTALRGLRDDRGGLDAALAQFGEGTREARLGIDGLRGLAQAASGQMAREAELSQALKDDLSFLIDRGDALADRLEALVRAARPLAAEPPRVPLPTPRPDPMPAEPAFAAPAAALHRVRSQAERDLLSALRTTR